MDALVMVAQLLLGLSLLVGLHELGHLLTAKMFGMRVEKFSIGFPPKIIGFKWGETEYSIGAIPLGGFVKISGMVDESMDTEQMAQEPQPWEFRSKPAWQRLLVMLGGIIVNVVTGIIIFVFLVYDKGETYYSRDQVIKHGIVAHEIAEGIGLQNGDKILDISGKTYESINDLSGGDALLSSNGYYTVDRNGERVKVDIPRGFVNSFTRKEDLYRFVSLREPIEVYSFSQGSTAEKSGLQQGDKIVAINNTPVRYLDELRSNLTGELKGQTAVFQIERGGQTLEKQIEIGEDGTIGFFNTPPEPVVKKYNFAQAIPKGTEKAFGAVIDNARAMGKLFTGEVSAKNVSGPIGFAKIYGDQWDWVKFWTITGLISMILAFMNLLPIPALDGGHVMFLLYEMISGRSPSDKFLENAQKIGMVFLLVLMVFVIGNDIFKLFTGS